MSWCSSLSYWFVANCLVLVAVERLKEQFSFHFPEKKVSSCSVTQSHKFLFENCKLDIMHNYCEKWQHVEMTLISFYAICVFNPLSHIFLSFCLSGAHVHGKAPFIKSNFAASWKCNNFVFFVFFKTGYKIGLVERKPFHSVHRNSITDLIELCFIWWE